MNSRFVLYNKSCLDAMRDMESKSVDLVLTDPPYNLGLFMQNRATNLKAMRENFFGAAGWDDLEFADWEKEMDLFFAELSRVVKESSSVIMFMSIIKVETIKNPSHLTVTGICVVISMILLYSELTQLREPLLPEQEPLQQQELLLPQREHPRQQP